MKTDATPQAIYLKDYQAPIFTIDSVELYFELKEGETLVKSSMSIRKVNAEHPCSDLELQGEALELVSVCVDGQTMGPSGYEVSSEGLTLKSLPDQCLVSVVTRITPEENTALEGLYKSGSLYCTQCEAHGFRKITYYLDRPDVMATFTTTIVADKTKYPVLLSNGNCVGGGDIEAGLHWKKWEDPFKKPSYLFALVAGDLHCHPGTFTTCSGREIRLEIFVEHMNKDKCEHAMNALIKAMKWDEETYGREYDLDRYMIVAVNDFNMGAMENKGLNIFNSKFVLAKPQTATDQDYLDIESVIAHEYFHNWTGNRITCRDWFQLSLKEGLTVFRDQEFSADVFSRPVMRIQDVTLLRNGQFPEDAGPLAHPVKPDSYIEMNNFYTATVYNKGAEVIRMQQSLVGVAGFFKGMDLYFERHDGQAVTTDDFVRCMEDANGVDLTQFKLWYTQAGTPSVEVATNYDAETQQFQLKFTQSCPQTPGQTEKRPMHIPIKLGLLDAQGQVVEFATSLNTNKQTSHLLELRAVDTVVTIPNMEGRPIPSLLQGFSAPIQLTHDLTDADLMHLFKYDTDTFNRWEAGQTLFLKAIQQSVNAIHNGESFEVDSDLLDILRETLNYSGQDPAYVAQLLALPSESYIIEQSTHVDPDAIHAAREDLKHSIAIALKDDFEKHYELNQGQDKYQIDSVAIGKRSLKNSCLHYLMSLGDKSVEAICYQQYQAATNMTDREAALFALASSNSEHRTEALEHFYQQWKHEPLVVDKWLNIQARSTRVDTLKVINRLRQHEAFTIKNPNKVRALLGGLCVGNPVHFHNHEGRGYQILTQAVIELNSINPQTGARLLKSLGNWKKLDEERQAHIKSGLKEILSLTHLSKDIYEIASKTLAY